MNGFDRMSGQTWGQGFPGQYPGQSPIQIERQDPRAQQYSAPQYQQQPYGGGQQVNFQPSYYMQGQNFQPGQYGRSSGNNQTLVKVLSEAEAQSYLVAPGNSVAMIDSAGRKLFVKSVDMDGSPSFERYALIPEQDPEPIKQEHTEAHQEKPEEYVTRREYEELKKDHDKLMEIMQKLAERVSGDKNGSE